MLYLSTVAWVEMSDPLEEISRRGYRELWRKESYVNDSEGMAFPLIVLNLKVFYKSYRIGES